MLVGLKVGEYTDRKVKSTYALMGKLNPGEKNEGEQTITKGQKKVKPVETKR